MKYRAEIDGLRALAVIPVILFHAGFELFSGGFVGVDVFFVISGYLITTILIEDIEKQRFSLVNFYERRARRILPALYFVMFVCIPFAWMWMLPSQMEDFSQSLIAVSLFISNILFWKTSDYFGPANEEIPLLHTWSLAVEEQYYMLFPIFLILTWRFGKNRVFWMIVIMAAISLLLSEWGWRNKPTPNFFLAPTRAWELFAGSIAAFIVQRNGVQKNNALALLGLSAIVFSIFAYDESTPFPSVYALVPVLGVVLLVLYAEKHTLVAKLLSTKAFVSVGLISYSAYLWHQPLFAFARIRLLNHPSELVMIILICISFVLAYFSWKYVEKPFRDKSGYGRKAILSGSLVGIIVLFSFGLVGHLENGIPNRIDNSIIELLDVQGIEKDLRDDGGCNRYLDETQIEACIFGYEDNVTVALIGDSHATAIKSALNYYGLLNNIGFVGHTKNGCPFVRHLQSTNLENCFEFVDGVFRWLENNRNIDTVIIAHRLQYYISNNDYENGVGGTEFFGINFYGTVSTLYQEPDIRREAILTEFDNTIRLLAKNFPDIKIILASPIPEHGWNVLQQLAKSLMFTEENATVYPLPINRYLERNEAVFLAINELERLPNITVYRVDDHLCDERSCSSVRDGMPLYYDDDHLTKLGGQIAFSGIVNLIKE